MSSISGKVSLCPVKLARTVGLPFKLYLVRLITLIGVHRIHKETDLYVDTSYDFYKLESSFE